MSWNRRLSPFMAGAVLVWVSACSGESTSDAGSAEPVPLGELPTRLAESLCNSVANCCSQYRQPHDVGNCVATARSEFARDLPTEPRATVQYDPQAAGDCIAWYSEWFGSCGLPPPPRPPACDRIFRGTLPEGAACEFDGECAVPEGG